MVSQSSSHFCLFLFFIHGFIKYKYSYQSQKRPGYEIARAITSTQEEEQTNQVNLISQNDI